MTQISDLELCVANIVRFTCPRHNEFAAGAGPVESMRFGLPSPSDKRRPRNVGTCSIWLRGHIPIRFMRPWRTTSMKMRPASFCAANCLFSVDVKAIFVAEDFTGFGRTAIRCFTRNAGISQENSDSPASKRRPRITSSLPTIRELAAGHHKFFSAIISENLASTYGQSGSLWAFTFPCALFSDLFNLF